jgi:16S rRNA (guanine527-N7)-methyltransferase
MIDIIIQYFPKLNALQQQQFEQLGILYREWNEKINLISRKDIDALYEHHILHSLGIAKLIQFKPGADIMDLGTGGGLPGIPLAIVYPETNFLMVDGTRKKITATQGIIESLDLKNAEARHIRAEEVKQQFDFVVCRAVTSLDKLTLWSIPLIKKTDQHAMPNGLITLKGGNLKEEIKLLPKGTYVQQFPLSNYFNDPYYEEKFAVYVQP